MMNRGISSYPADDVRHDGPSAATALPAIALTALMATNPLDTARPRLDRLHSRRRD